VATQNTGSGDAKTKAVATQNRAVATQHIGSGDTKHRKWRRKTQAAATKITGRGDAKQRQWRHKIRTVATQNTGSNVFQRAFRRWVKYCTLHNELHLAYTHNGTTDINSVLLDDLTVVNILGLTPYSLVGYIPTKHTDSILHYEDEGSMFLRSIGAQQPDLTTQSTVKGPIHPTLNCAVYLCKKKLHEKLN